MNICQKERFFFFTHAITILSLFTYFVCDEKVKTKMKMLDVIDLDKIWTFPMFESVQTSRFVT